MPEGYHHLTRDQRCQFLTLKRRGDSIASIANVVGVHRSTLYREEKRNSGKRTYWHKLANDKALARRHAASAVKRKMTARMISLIKENCNYNGALRRFQVA